MQSDIHVPIFSDIVPGGFKHGANYLVEFDPNSLWYESSLTITAHALKAGLRTQYHTFMHIPAEIRQELQKLNLDSKKFEDEDRFRMIDSYTPLTGLPIQPEPSKLFPTRERIRSTIHHIWRNTLPTLRLFSNKERQRQTSGGSTLTITHRFSTDTSRKKMS